MRASSALRLLLVAVASMPGAVAWAAQSSGDLTRAQQRVYPALVNITVVTRYFADGRAQRAPAGGSGVIVTPDGYVLTNYHVAGHATRITCTLLSGQSLEAKVVTHDPLTDISVLHLVRKHGAPPLSYAHLGDSDKLRVGEPVLAMGNPLMLASSVTRGIVSNCHRVFTDFIGTEMEDMTLEGGEKTGMFTQWIQHDALILPGNSGGPLVNLRGEVVGINELGGGGVGFAIPSNIAREVLRQAIAHGKVVRGYLGVTVLPVDKMGRTTGALVAGVAPGSPAQKAGIKAGDVVLAVGAAPVAVRFFEQVPAFYRRLAALRPGTAVSVTVLRAGKKLRLRAIAARMESDAGKEVEIRAYGFSAQQITGFMAYSMTLPTRRGCLVTGVREGYPFETAQPKIQAGDIVTQMAGRPTPNLQALRQAAAAAGGRDVLVTFQRGDQQIVSLVKHHEEDTGGGGGELPHAWIGVKTQVFTEDIATSLGMPNTHGFRVTEVYDDTKAAQSGLHVGDIITALDGSALDASQPQDAADLRQAVENLNIGDKAELTVLRNGKPVMITVRLEATPSSGEEAKRSRQKELEFAVRELTRLDRLQDRRWRDAKGLLISDVSSGGWAQTAGLHVDDLLMAVNGQTVTTVDGFEKVMKTIVQKRPRVVELFVQRGYRTHFVFIEPDWGKLSSQ